MTVSPQEPAATPTPSCPSRTSLIAALVVAIVFLGVSIWLLSKFGDDWNHVTVVYNALCSIAFTAFGVLLGSKVQEVNVAKATATATDAKADAAKKSDAIKTALTTLRPVVGASDESGGGSGAAVKSSRDAHEILLRALN